jgi:ABC-type uncharacterized transport system substrate-binding protein
MKTLKMRDPSRMSLAQRGRRALTSVVCGLALMGLPLSLGCRDELPTKPKTAGASEVTTGQPSGSGTVQKDLRGRRVLLVHSYHPEYPWVDSVTQGVKATLDGTGLVLEVIYMDTKRHTDDAWKTEAGRRAKQKVDEYRPDLILTCDDDAQQFFARTYVNTAVPVVFTGVDADPSKYGYPAANVTGVIERPHLKESLALAQRLRPIKRVAVLSCRDSTSVAALGFMKQEQLNVEVTEWLLVDDFDQWKEAVSRFNKTVDALVIRSYQALKQPGSQVNADPKEVGAWTARNATIPTVAFHDFEIKDGILVGTVKSGQEYGRQASEYGLELLRGAKAESLPVTRTKTGVRMMNAETAARLGVSLTNEMTKEVTVVSGS